MIITVASLIYFYSYIEHQLAQHRRKQTGSAATNVSDLFDDNEVDKIGPKSKFLIIL
jgi:hypothetical protein